ncbi:hypothetical protein BDW59DRAFT_161080 [Aspergillus cavernicola]|uniref:Uncharacterized protein n=1 Tax=Aspergillus cavernicola TaxID=176166 RepID=A0ABR4IH98_9EURO
MTVIVNPYIPLASVADRDKFLSLVRNVAIETQDHEPRCLAYCWTCPVAERDGSTDSPALVQGLEIYATEDALIVTHRSGTAYKEMRKVVAATGLLSYPKGGVPTYCPAGASFLSKAEVSETVSPENYFVVLRYTVRGEGNVSRFIKEERLLAGEMEHNHKVLGVWCFKPDSPGEEVAITIFIRLAGIGYYTIFQKDIAAFESRVLKQDEITQTTFWGGHGFGFFRQGT